MIIDDLFDKVNEAVASIEKFEQESYVQESISRETEKQNQQTKKMKANSQKHKS